MKSIRQGKLTTLKLQSRDHLGRPYCLCQCDCGQTRTFLLASVRNGLVKSCGNCRKVVPKNSPPKRKQRDLTGQRFGKLVVVRRDRETSRGSFWDCACDCGGFITVSEYCIYHGKTKSCGCAKKYPNRRKPREAYIVGSKNTSGYSGVFRTGGERARWRSRIFLDGRSKHIGTFATAREAALARDNYIIENDLIHWLPLQVLPEVAIN